MSSFAFTVTVNCSTGFSVSLKLAVSSTFFSTKNSYVASAETAFPSTVQFTNSYPSLDVAMAFTFSPLAYSAFTGSSFTSPILVSFAFTFTVNVSSTGSFALKFALSSMSLSTVNLYSAFLETSSLPTVQFTNSYLLSSFTFAVAVTSVPSLYLSASGLSFAVPIASSFTVAVTVYVFSTGGCGSSFALKFALSSMSLSTVNLYSAFLETSSSPTVQFTNSYLLSSFTFAVAVTSVPSLYLSTSGLSFAVPIASSFTVAVTVYSFTSGTSFTTVIL